MRLTGIAGLLQGNFMMIRFRNYISHLHRILAFCLILLVLQGVLFAKAPSNQERYAYKYIVLLYEKGDTSFLDTEIKDFLSLYPDSNYATYVKYLQANILLQEGNYEQALSIYNELQGAELDVPVKSSMMLNRAICLYQLKDFGPAMQQLMQIEQFTQDQSVLVQAGTYQARIYAQLGQKLSAIRAYQKVLQNSQNQDISYEYFLLLLDSNKPDEAEPILDELMADELYAVPSGIEYARYLQNNARVDDYRRFISQNPDLENELQIQLLSLRQAIAEEDYVAAQELLEANQEDDPYLNYYRAIYALKQGNSLLADELFAELVQSAPPELRVLSYLERLKILYEKEPVAAMLQLGQYAQNPENSIAKAEQYLCLGYFAYQKQDYLEALKQYNLARNHSTEQKLRAEIDLMIAKSWLKAKRADKATEVFNRYLNLYPQSRERDSALFYLGFIYHEQKDYPQAKAAFSRLVEKYPDSPHLPPAKFYLAEMDYYLANYNLALTAFLQIMDAEPENSDAALRVAQIYYYLQEYEQSEFWLQKISPNYDSLILSGHVYFNKKDYQSALQMFSLAERSTQDRLRIAEAQSYRALCLYQLKRYAEATELYLTLFEGSESPDTYLYLAAKSAYAAGDYHQALSLYDQFVDTYPQSQYFLPVLADIANSYYNLGNFTQAVQDYQNIISRFRNTREFSEADRVLLGEVFTGLELALKRADNPQLTLETAQMTDTFQSLYISFELSFILLKIYAENSQWQDVIDSAEALRREFPEVKRNEVELLMADSLVKLNELAAADSLLSDLYRDSQDPVVLVRIAEIDYLAGDYLSSLQKYQQAFAVAPSEQIWYNMLQASSNAEYQDFETLWQLGEFYQAEIPPVRILRLKQQVYAQEWQSALEYTDTIINESLSNHDHAMAFLYKAIIYYAQEHYDQAIAEANRCLMLFPDFLDIQDQAAYYLIRSYLALGDYAEAQAQLWDLGSLLSEENMAVLNGLMESER